MSETISEKYEHDMGAFQRGIKKDATKKLKHEVKE